MKIKKFLEPNFKKIFIFFLIVSLIFLIPTLLTPPNAEFPAYHMILFSPLTFLLILFVPNLVSLNTFLQPILAYGSFILWYFFLYVISCLIDIKIKKFKIPKIRFKIKKPKKFHPFIRGTIIAIVILIILAIMFLVWFYVLNPYLMEFRKIEKLEQMGLETQRIIDENDNYIKIANETNNISICENINPIGHLDWFNESDRESMMPQQDFCYMQIAVNMNNSSLCEKMTKLDYYSTVGSLNPQQYCHSYFGE
ncbi:MAG: hypothetical protein ACW981_19570 [Candidatus Hodarchaeales archaeon]|jgi:hypothetical protein